MMHDLVIVELIIALCLFLAMLRPYVKRFRGVDGIAVLPVVACLAALAVYPAYGFRPEFLPLQLLVFVVFLGSLPRLIDMMRHLRTDDYGEKGHISIVVGLFFVFLTTGFAIAFAPKSMAISDKASFFSQTMRDTTRDIDYYIRIYPGQKESSASLGQKRPVVIIAPPALGSLNSIDELSFSLSERGFVVVSFSRSKIDFPAIREDGHRQYPGVSEVTRSLSAFIWGTKFAYAARAGAILERERVVDFGFMVSSVREAIATQKSGFEGVAAENMIIMGYGVGAAAVTAYAATGPTDVVAAIAVEGPIFSTLLLEKDEDTSVASRPGFFGTVISWFAKVGKHLKPGHVVGVSDAIVPVIPTLFIESDLVKDPVERDGRYASVLRSFRLAAAPCALVSMSGAGILDYSDIPDEYPVYAAVTHGEAARTKDSGYYSERLAALVANFAGIFIDSSDTTISGAPLAVDTWIETSGPWNLDVVPSILRP